jgi:hypothetical protein
MFQISDEEVQEAFAVLHSNQHARKRAAYEYAEKRLKVALAKSQLAAEGKTVGEREANALTSKDYQAALEAFRAISEAYHEARDMREAAVAVIDAYRTQQSDRRAMRNAA